MKRYLPIYMDISDRKIVIVGGGNVALQKLVLLKNIDCDIRVVAPEVMEEIRKANVDIRQEEYASSCLDDADIVYVCTGDRDLNKRVRLDAAHRGILVNVVDDPSKSDFISPAVYAKDEMVVAVSSNATDVKRSIRWRDTIKTIFDNDNI